MSSAKDRSASTKDRSHFTTQASPTTDEAVSAADNLGLHIREDFATARITGHVAHGVSVNQEAEFQLGDRFKIENLTINKADSSKTSKDPTRKDFLDWLLCIDFWFVFRDRRRRWTQGTGSWFVEHEAFQEWFSGGENQLWCHGDPGCGKTILATIAIDHIKLIRESARPSIGYAFLYCTHSDPKQTAVNLVRSLLHQLAVQADTVSAELLSLYKKHTSASPPTEPSLEECMELLEQEAKRFSTVFVVVDALDECRDDDGNADQYDTRSILMQALSSLDKGVHILVTSRNVPLEQIESSPSLSFKRMKITAVDEDVRQYVGTRIEHDKNLRAMAKKATLKTDIVTTIVKKAAGMFLLAQLQMDLIADLARRRQPSLVRQELENLPLVLSAAYKQILGVIWVQHEIDIVMARNVLSIIVFAKNASWLKIDLVRRALSLTAIDKAEDIEDIEEDVILSICRGLVTVDRESRTISFVHYTATEYFSSTQVQTAYLPEGQLYLARSCIACLSLSSTDGERRHPLFQYAARCWGFHAQAAGEAAFPLVKDFLSKKAKLHHSFQLVLNDLPQTWFPNTNTKENLRSISCVEDVHAAAYFGLESLAMDLLSSKDMFEIQDCRGWTPLRWAAIGARDEMVRLLLERKANVLSTDGEGQPTLHWAFGARATRNVHGNIEAYGNSRVLFGDITVFKSKSSFVNARQRVVSPRTSPKVLKRLLGCLKITDVTRERDGRTLLSIAAENWQWSTVEQLLRLGADINRRDIGGITALLWALQSPRRTDKFDSFRAYDVSELVVGNQIHVEPSSEISVADNDVSEQFLEAALCTLIGEDLEARDEAGRTALSLAVEGRYHTVVSTLLKRGADPNAADRDGNTPLHFASCLPYLRTVLQGELSCFCQSKVQVGGKKLSQMLLAKHNDLISKPVGRIVSLLLSHKAHKALRNAQGRTALDLAVLDGLESVIRILRSEDERGVFSQTIETQNLSWTLPQGLDQVEQQDYTKLLVAMLSERTKIIIQQGVTYDQSEVAIDGNAHIKQLHCFDNSTLCIRDQAVIDSLTGYGRARISIEAITHIGDLQLFDRIKLRTDDRSVIDQLSCYGMSEMVVGGSSEIHTLTASDRSRITVESRAKIGTLSSALNSFIHIKGDAKISNATINDRSRLLITNAANVDTLFSSENGLVFIKEDAKISNVTITDKSRLLIEKGANVDTLSSSEDGLVFIKEDAKISNAIITDRSRLMIEKGAIVGSLSCSRDATAHIRQARENTELWRFDTTDQATLCIDTSDDDHDQIWEFFSEEEMQAIQGHLSEISHTVAEDEFREELPP